MCKLERAVTFGRFDNLSSKHTEMFDLILKKYKYLHIVVCYDCRRTKENDFLRMCNENQKRTKNKINTSYEIILNYAYKKKKNITVSIQARPEQTPNEFNEIFRDDEYDLVFPVFLNETSASYDNSRINNFERIFKRNVTTISIAKSVHQSEGVNYSNLYNSHYYDYLNSSLKHDSIFDKIISSENLVYNGKLNFSPFLGTEDNFDNDYLNQYIIFKDKLKMREALEVTILQPKFNDLNIDKLLLKPRFSSSAIGIELFNNRSFDSENYLVEQFIDYDTMYTTDGIFNGNEIESLFVSKYKTKLLDYKSDKNIISVVLEDDEPKIYNMLRTEISKVINKIGIKDKRLPFHGEWFYQKENNSVIFCEIGARFPGVGIPKLYNYTYNINIYDSFFLNKEINISNVTPHSIIISKGREGRLRINNDIKLVGVKDEICYYNDFDEIKNSDSVVNNIYLVIVETSSLETNLELLDEKYVII